MTRLVLTRHGQSQWNLENRFTGWVDVDLTEKGEAEARKGGVLMREAGFEPSYAYTSVLKRAIRTLWIGLEELDRVWIPVEKHWRLNERHYGKLTGLDKAETAERHGEEQVHVWRRSYDVPPPPLELDDPNHPRHDPRYRGLEPDLLPSTESLKLTLARVQPYWDETIAPRVKAGEDVLVAAHGNSLRALIKLLFDVGDRDIVNFELPTANPLLIELNGLRPVQASYLDPDRAKDLPPCP